MANSLIFNYVDAAKKKSLDKAISFIDVLKDVSVISYDDTSIRQEINDVSSFAHNIYVPGHVSELMNDAGYLNADDVSVFVTKEELNAKNYLTEHQSLDGYAKNADINIHLNNLDVSVEAAIEQAKADVSTAIDNVLQTLDLGIVNVEQYTDDKVLALNNDLSAVISANKTSASNDLDYAITRVRGDFDASFLALEAAKQDAFIIGNGLALEDGILSTTIDTTLFRIVNELPASDIDETKIYLVASHNPVLGDVYTEHIHADGGWEKLGEFKATTDLSGYYNKTEVDNIVANVAQAFDASIAAAQNDNALAHAEIDSQISALQAADASIQASVDEKTQANASAIQTLEGLVSDHKAITDSNSAAIESHDASIIAIVAKEASDYSTLASLISSNESAIADTNQKVQQNADAIAAADASLNESLANLATTVAGKASTSDLEALEIVVNSKANSDDLSALATSVETKAEVEDVSLALSGKADADDLQTLTTVVQGIQDIDAVQDTSIASLEENDEIQDTSIGIALSKADELEASLAVTDSSVGEILSTLEGHAQSITADEESIAGNAGEISILKAQVESLNANYSNLLARFNALVEEKENEQIAEIEASQEQIVVEQGTSVTASDTTKNFAIAGTKENPVDVAEAVSVTGNSVALSNVISSANEKNMTLVAK